MRKSGKLRAQVDCKMNRNRVWSSTHFWHRAEASWSYGRDWEMEVRCWGEHCDLNCQWCLMIEPCWRNEMVVAWKGLELSGELSSGRSHLTKSTSLLTSSDCTVVIREGGLKYAADLQLQPIGSFWRETDDMRSFSCIQHSTWWSTLIFKKEKKKWSPSRLYTFYNSTQIFDVRQDTTWIDVIWRLLPSTVAYMCK